MGYIQTCKADFHAYLPLVGCLSSRLPRKIIRVSTYKEGSQRGVKQTIESIVQVPRFWTRAE